MDTTKKEIGTDNRMVPLISDFCFKEVFGNEKYQEPLILLMSILLDIPCEELEEHVLFLPKEPKDKRIESKKGDKDIVFKLDLSEPYKINLEANKNPNVKDSVLIRNLYWLTNLFGSELKIKENYKNIKATIQFNFNTYFVDTLHKDLVEEYLMRNEKGWILDKRLKSVHLNVAEMGRLWYNGNYQKYDERMRCIICLGALMVIKDKEDFKRCLEEIPSKEEIKEVMERIVDDMNEDVEFITRYYDKEEEEKRLLDYEFYLRYENGKKEGLKEGEKNGQLAIIQNMLNDNLKISEISKITHMSEEKTQKLLDEN